MTGSIGRIRPLPYQSRGVQRRHVNHGTPYCELRRFGQEPKTVFFSDMIRLGKPVSTALYLEQMPRPNKQFVRAILIGLMLIVGSVQAHVSYYCGILETVIHDDCCCADSDLDDAMATESEPCCEKSVELLPDGAEDQARTTAKPVKFESDVDPPEALAPEIGLSLPTLGATSISGVNDTGISHTPGSTTYLITQRLRL